MQDKDLELEPVDMYVLFAKMFSHITREVEKACGEDGVKAVREGVRQFGLERGRNIAERAKAMGHENDAKSYLSCYDMGRSELFKSENDIREKTVEQNFTECIFAKQFMEDHDEKYGIHYCEMIDPAIAEGYNEKFKCTHDKHFFKDGCCHFLFEMEE
ncbi:L-2-amino-thiazoline-4-carboxylic acid hydrolase [Clostridium transplantifaecale]|uniref:L-2-amino-thiazoline-4-carboxylic acid hydrolase n=1 Tax=Clostridium transplantifaecale TaxID=2479838 RepID=UPI000F642B3B|nr:L-2-amino-thiazoline-4-carboxylic acid hydrolase [Clostridium transplantifaecale]